MAATSIARRRRTGLIAGALLVALLPQVTPQARAAAATGKIAFTSNRTGNFEIRTMNGDGSNPTRLTNYGGEDREPAWSPDGTRIAFVRRMPGRGYNYEIFLMNADGSALRNLTHSPGFDGDPDWGRQ